MYKLTSTVIGFYCPLEVIILQLFSKGTCSVTLLLHVNMLFSTDELPLSLCLSLLTFNMKRQPQKAHPFKNKDETDSTLCDHNYITGQIQSYLVCIMLCACVCVCVKEHMCVPDTFRKHTGLHHRVHRASHPWLCQPSEPRHLDPLGCRTTHTASLLTHKHTRMIRIILI